MHSKMRESDKSVTHKKQQLSIEVSKLCHILYFFDSAGYKLMFENDTHYYLLIFPSF